MKPIYFEIQSGIYFIFSLLADIWGFILPRKHPIYTMLFKSIAALYQNQNTYLNRLVSIRNGQTGNCKPYYVSALLWSKT